MTNNRRWATERPNSRASVDLYWLPLGAGTGGQCVRGSGRLYEALTAMRAHRPRLDLYHSALVVHVDDHAYAIEMAPVWAVATPDRGVISEGPVGSPSLGRLRLFRYEIHCWRDGTIPDMDEAVDSPERLSTDQVMAREVVKLVPSCPVLTWGRDELLTGEMWNSNSLTAWLLARSGHDTDGLRAPRGGRAPGWSAGLSVAARTHTAVTGAVPPTAIGTSPRNASTEAGIH